jgi:hypothetical protein
MKKQQNSLLIKIINHPFLIGIMILVMNLCSRNIILDIPEEIQDIMENIWVRRMAVFSTIFITTRSFEIALLITLIFIIVFQYLLKKGSRICLLRQNDKNNVSKKEFLIAKKIVDKYQIYKIKEKLHRET